MRRPCGDLSVVKSTDARGAHPGAGRARTSANARRLQGKASVAWPLHAAGAMPEANDVSHAPSPRSAPHEAAGASPPRWALVVIPPAQRKRDEAFTIARALRDHGLRVGGFAQRRAARGGRAYEVVSLGVEAPPVPIARRGVAPGPGEEPFCNCAFRPDAFATARGWLDEALSACDVVVLDEVSRLEATGGGHAAAVSLALARAPLTVLSVRADRLSPLMERFGLADPCAVLEQGDPPAAFVAAILDSIGGAPRSGARPLPS